MSLEEAVGVACGWAGPAGISVGVALEGQSPSKPFLEGQSMSMEQSWGGA